MKGIIFFWHGSLEDIPDGWALCDGTQGTRDLRNFFIFGAGISKNPGDKWIFASHNHLFAGDGHSHSMIGGDNVSPGAGMGTQFFEFVISGKTDPIAALPPYRALYPIVKLP